MLVTLNWLRERVDFELDAEALAEQLTIAGLEVDDVVPVAAGLEDILVAEVCSVETHPNADRLSLCQIKAGTESRQVVCGAPNVRQGIRVPYAPVGACLPGGAQIRAAEIRGVMSEGMLCSGKELSLSDDASGLMVLDADAPVGEALIDYLDLRDWIIDIDLTPNRGDCFSIEGIARDIAAKCKAPFHPVTLEPVRATTDEVFAVSIAAESACLAFSSRVLSGIDNRAISPTWMRERLRRSGIRSINPVVDVTNYVMLELGQPLHAYDLALLRGGIDVRMANAKETLTLLDGRRIELADDVLVIADDRGPIGMAGIMGGESTGVTAESTHILLEAAHFTPEAIAGRARRFGMHTDASVRFERGVDPQSPVRAIERASSLLLSIVGGNAGPTEVVETSANAEKSAAIALSHRRLESVLGMKVAGEVVESILKSLGMEVTRQGDDWNVEPPSFRFDLEIEEDLFEEVARIVGYDAIPAVTGVTTSNLGTATELQTPIERIANLLTDRGYNEVVTYSFVDESLDAKVNPERAAIALANPISRELAVMRQSLWPGLLSVAQHNLSRQETNFRLYELGTQFASAGNAESVETQIIAGIAVGDRLPTQWGSKTTAVDFYDVKGDLEALFASTGGASAVEFQAVEHPALRPGHTAKIVAKDESIGWIGELHPALMRDFEFKVPVFLFELSEDAVVAAEVPKHREISKFPSVRRDLSLVVQDTISSAAIEREVRQLAGPLLKELIVFDVYRGPGVGASGKSIAIGLILQDGSRTLTDGDADRVIANVTQGLERSVGAKIRTK